MYECSRLFLASLISTSYVFKACSLKFCNMFFLQMFCDLCLVFSLVMLDKFSFLVAALQQSIFSCHYDLPRPFAGIFPMLCFDGRLQAKRRRNIVSCWTWAAWASWTRGNYAWISGHSITGIIQHGSFAVVCGVAMPLFSISWMSSLQMIQNMGATKWKQWVLRPYKKTSWLGLSWGVGMWAGSFPYIQCAFLGKWLNHLFVQSPFSRPSLRCPFFTVPLGRTTQTRSAILICILERVKNWCEPTTHVRLAPELLKLEVSNVVFTACSFLVSFAS